jgi:hypothetical protein
MFSLSKPCLTCQNSESLATSSGPASWNYTLYAEHLTSSAPTVRGAVHGSKRAETDVCATCRSWIAWSRCDCRSDGLNAPIAIIGPGKKVRPSATASSGRSGFTSKYARNSCMVARAKSLRVATVSPPARCFAGHLKSAEEHGQENWGASWALMNTHDVRDIATIRSWSTWRKVAQSPRLKGVALTTW